MPSGGVRRNSGRPKGGISNARRRIMDAYNRDGEDGCVQVVHRLVSEGEGHVALKIWADSISVYAEWLDNNPKSKTRKRDRSFVDKAYDRMGQLDL